MWLSDAIGRQSFVNISTGDHLQPNRHQAITLTNTDSQFYL